MNDKSVYKQYKDYPVAAVIPISSSRELVIAIVASPLPSEPALVVIAYASAIEEKDGSPFLTGLGLEVRGPLPGLAQGEDNASN